MSVLPGCLLNLWRHYFATQHDCIHITAHPTKVTATPPACRPCARGYCVGAGLSREWQGPFSFDGQQELNDTPISRVSAGDGERHRRLWGENGLFRAPSRRALAYAPLSRPPFSGCFRCLKVPVRSSSPGFILAENPKLGTSSHPVWTGLSDCFKNSTQLVQQICFHCVETGSLPRVPTLEDTKTKSVYFISPPNKDAADMMSVITCKNENCDLNGVRVAKHRNSPSERRSSTVTRQSQLGIIDKAFRHRRGPERGKMRTILYFSAFLFWSHIFISRSLDRKIFFFLIVFFLFVPHSRSAVSLNASCG